MGKPMSQNTYGFSKLDSFPLSCKYHARLGCAQKALEETYVGLLGHLWGDFRASRYTAIYFVLFYVFIVSVRNIRNSVPLLMGKQKVHNTYVCHQNVWDKTYRQKTKWHEKKVTELQRNTVCGSQSAQRHKARSKSESVFYDKIKWWSHAGIVPRCKQCKFFVCSGFCNPSPPLYFFF